ncbi:MAG: hypothetical protein EYX74_00365 [Desulfobulbaceae bacterium]|nr:MAG: hypothetical protein EYX74_00365 [Desulfobulbaceae bacterium]
MIRTYGVYRSKMVQSGRRPTGGDHDPINALFKALGVVLLVAALLAIFSGFWVAWAVRSGLDEMAVEQFRASELRQQHQKLSQRRDQLLTADRIKEMAVELGLFPPQNNQVRRP